MIVKRELDVEIEKIKSNQKVQKKDSQLKRNN